MKALQGRRRAPYINGDVEKESTTDCQISCPLADEERWSEMMRLQHYSGREGGGEVVLHEEEEGSQGRNLRLTSLFLVFP